jgi:acyl-CoA synthetase (AMP-forming)/AMP-acid ligase II
MLFQKMTEIANTAPSTSGIRQDGVAHSYADLIARVERLAGGFKSIGIGKGDRVVLFIPNSVDIWIVSHALFAIGAITVPLNAQANPNELKSTGERCAAKAIVARPEYLAVAERLNADLGGKLTVVQTGSSGPLSVGELEKHAPANLQPFADDDDAVYLFSSGSTGRSKIVPWTHGALIRGGVHSAGLQQIQPDDASLNGLPSYTSYGYIVGIGGDAFAGATTVFWTDPQPIMMARGRMLAAIEREKITRLPGVPFLFDLLAGVTDNVDMSSVRMASSGGVAIKKPTFDRFYQRFGIPVRQALGLTEVGLVTFNMDPDPVSTWDSVGKPDPQVSVEIVPTPEAPSPDVGEIFVKTPGMTKGYMDVEPAVNAVFRNGGMMTGDLGRIGDNGHLYITGRIKFIVEVSGMKVDPIEVEDVLMSHPAVADAVVVGVPDPRTGEQRLKAVVVRKADETADNIIKFSRTRLTPHKVPALLEFREQIPRNGAGKVLRSQLVD